MTQLQAGGWGLKIVQWRQLLSTAEKYKSVSLLAVRHYFGGIWRYWEANLLRSQAA